MYVWSSAGQGQCVAPPSPWPPHATPAYPPGPAHNTLPSPSAHKHAHRPKLRYLGYLVQRKHSSPPTAASPRSMWPLTGPSALKPSLVGVGALTACAPPTSSVGGSRPHRSRHSLCSRRVSLDVSRLSLDGRRASLSAWPSPVAAATALASSPSATDLCLEEPFSLAWAFASLDTHPESRADGHETSGASTPRRSTSDSAPSPVPQQVTRHNFHLALPLVAEALQECTFFALDCEFTGLSPQAPHFSELYDDAGETSGCALRGCTSSHHQACHATHRADWCC